MKRRFVSCDPYPLRPPLLICAAAFICGALVGSAAACMTSNGSQLAADASVLLGRGDGGYAGCLLNMIKFHLAGAFLGFSVLGVFLIPALCALRGFLLAFSVAAVTRAFASFGLAAASFGITLAVSLPCLLVICVQAYSSSQALLRAASYGSCCVRPKPFGASPAAVYCLCALLLALAALVDSVLLQPLAFDIMNRLTL